MSYCCQFTDSTEDIQVFVRFLVTASYLNNSTVKLADGFLMNCYQYVPFKLVKLYTKLNKSPVPSPLTPLSSPVTKLDITQLTLQSSPLTPIIITQLTLQSSPLTPLSSPVTKLDITQLTLQSSPLTPIIITQLTLQSSPLTPLSSPVTKLDITQLTLQSSPLTPIIITQLTPQLSPLIPITITQLTPISSAIDPYILSNWPLYPQQLRTWNHTTEPWVITTDHHHNQPTDHEVVEVLDQLHHRHHLLGRGGLRQGLNQGRHRRCWQLPHGAVVAGVHPRPLSLPWGRRIPRLRGATGQGGGGGGEGLGRQAGLAAEATVCWDHWILLTQRYMYIHICSYTGVHTYAHQQRQRCPHKDKVNVSFTLCFYTISILNT